MAHHGQTTPVRAAGDHALRLLALAIGGELRPSDICGRVGGDEFMLAIVRYDVAEAGMVVERLRTNIAGMELGPAGQTVTISAGISEYPRHSFSREELMHLADGAMYWAKSNGATVRSCTPPRATSPSPPRRPPTAPRETAW